MEGVMWLIRTVCAIKLNKVQCFISQGAGIVQSVQRLATGQTVRVSNPSEGRDFPHPSIPALGVHPASCTMGTRYFPVVKRAGRGAEVMKGQGYTSTHPLGLRDLLQEEPLPLPCFISQQMVRITVQDHKLCCNCVPVQQLSIIIMDTHARWQRLPKSNQSLRNRREVPGTNRLIDHYNL